MSFIIQYQDVWALFPKCWDDECLKRQKKDMMLKMLTQGKGQVWRNNAVLLLREARAADISKKLEDYSSKKNLVIVWSMRAKEFSEWLLQMRWWLFSKLPIVIKTKMGNVLCTIYTGKWLPFPSQQFVRLW